MIRSSRTGDLRPTDGRVALGFRQVCGLVFIALLVSKFYPLDRPAWLVNNARLALDFAHIKHAQTAGPILVYAIGLVAIYAAAGYSRWPVTSDLATSHTRAGTAPVLADPPI